MRLVSAFPVMASVSAISVSRDRLEEGERAVMVQSGCSRSQSPSPTTERSPFDKPASFLLLPHLFVSSTLQAYSGTRHSFSLITCYSLPQQVKKLYSVMQ
jgi:hypothetical protein